MSLVPALLRAIVLVDGDSLVLHAGEAPYVTSSSGHVDLAVEGLSSIAVADVIGHVLPIESQHVLTQFGAVQYELENLPEFPGERFNVVATNEGVLGVEIWRRAGVEGAFAAPAVPPVAPIEIPPPVETVPPLETAATVATAGPGGLPTTTAPSAEQASPTRPEAGHEILERLLRAAIAGGASALYLASGSPPWVRVDDDLQVMEAATALTAGQIAEMLARAPDGGAAALGDTTRPWFWESPELGRVRCTSFRDHRGPGLVLRSVPTRPLTSRQLGLSREVEALASHADGLVMVAGSRGSGKRTVIAALVDLINRTRHVHVVSIERELSVVHEREASLVSQREAGRSLERMLELSRAALSEEPDVLVIETAQTAELMTLALEAAQGGRLVICGYSGQTAAGVLRGVVGLYPSARRQTIQLWLARTLLGVIVQAQVGGAEGTAPQDRELLLNTPEVAALIAEGRMSGLSPGAAR